MLELRRLWEGLSSWVLVHLLLLLVHHLPDWQPYRGEQGRHLESRSYRLHSLSHDQYCRSHQRRVLQPCLRPRSNHLSGNLCELRRIGRLSLRKLPVGLSHRSLSRRIRLSYVQQVHSSAKHWLFSCNEVACSNHCLKLKHFHHQTDWRKLSDYHIVEVISYPSFISIYILAI